MHAGGARFRPRRRKLIILLVAGTFFMEMLDGTVIATALPRIGRDFGVSAVALNIAVTAYLMALGAFLPISGWLADRIGARSLFTAAILLFTFASLLCGLSNSLWTFTAARALQGIGGAAMVPVGRLIVLRLTEKKQLAAAMATIVWPGLVAPVLGPMLGGYLVVYWSWPWIFYLNIPLGLLAAAAALILIPTFPGLEVRRPLDLSGFLLSGGALLLIIYGLDSLGNGQQPAPLSLAITGVGALIAVMGVRHLRRHPTPLLDLRPLRERSFRIVARGGSLQRVAIGAVPFLLPLMFQLGFGMDPVSAGGLVLMVFAGNLAMKLATIPLLARFGFRNAILVNGILAALAIGACALLTSRTPYWQSAILLFAGGAFRSMQFASLSGLQFTDVPQDQMNHASTLSSMLTQVAMGLAVVVSAGLLNLSAALQGSVLGRPTAADFRFALIGIMLISLLGLIDVVRLDPALGRSNRR